MLDRKTVEAEFHEFVRGHELSWNTLQRVQPLVMMRMMYLLEEMTGKSEEEMDEWKKEKKDEPIRTAYRSEFMDAICGKNPEEVWEIVEDAMETIKHINRKSYENIIERLKRL